MAILSTRKITPYLWFDNNAQEAAEYYCTVFTNSRILSTSQFVTEFELEGLTFGAINGGPQFQFSEAVSFMVLCKDQNEVDYFWNTFVDDGGAENRCGWCKDKFGVSWQVVPERFIEMLDIGTAEQKKAVFDVMMPMNKLIIEEFEKIFNA